MKKYVLILVAVMICGAGYAQKGRHAVGVNTSLNGFLSEPGALDEEVGLFIGLKYQYNISNIFRLEAQFSGEVIEGNNFDGTVNLHTFFIKEGRIRPYLITGCSFCNYHGYSYYYNYGDEDETDVAARLGLGVNTRLSYKWDLQLEMGYHTAYNEFVSLGLTYNF